MYSAFKYILITHKNLWNGRFLKVHCFIITGLEDGCYNVEMIMTSRGPKLIEVNGRMGGFYNRTWIKKQYGTDLVLYNYLIACGIMPHAPKHRPREIMMGIMLVPSHHRHILDNEATRQTLIDRHNRGELMFLQFASDADEAMFNANIEEPMANIAVYANSYTEAKEKLMKVCHEFNIHKEGYDVEKFTECFAYGIS